LGRNEDMMNPEPTITAWFDYGAERAPNLTALVLA
jgi:hypothetical protein